MQEKLLELIVAGQQRQEMQRVLDCNKTSGKYGLTLTKDDARQLLICRQNTLKEEKRVEFGEGILPKLIEAFCDSQYISQFEYMETLVSLQEIFYLFKNESMDFLDDDELIAFMREQFEGICYGSLEYLSETCMERFTRAIRSGYRGYRQSGGRGEYNNSKLSEEMRWDKDLFFEIWNELIS